jgi:predicted AlkP superfamily phosphohydrolase/phosphomutase
VPLRFRKTPPKVALIGLDCAEPSLLFGQFAGRLPALDALRARGVFGRLESVVPAITVPAWSCMLSGRDPGALGIYGFRNRADFSTDRLTTADSRAVKLPRLWDILGERGLKTIALNVPGTYPPPPLQGALVSCFLTPNAEAAFTQPPALKDALLREVGGRYPFDVTDFRSDDKSRLLAELRDMTAIHFQAARWLVNTQPDWRLFVGVEIGVDRIHHALWRHFDPQHRRYLPNSPYANAIFDYYRQVDREIAALISTFDDDTHIFVVSDHGARRMDGGFCFNDWLIREGYLVLHQPMPAEPTRLDKLKVDWSRTRAWGDGGYYGRLFLNIRGREPNGAVAPNDAPALLAELRARLEALPDDRGLPMGTRTFTAAELYPEVNGIPPDLLVYFGDLAWRSIGTIGWPDVYRLENDTGPDDANHAQHGVLLYAPPKGSLGGRELDGMHLLQVAPTVLTLLGLPIPAAMQREPIAAIIS